MPAFAYSCRLIPAERPPPVYSRLRLIVIRSSLCCFYYMQWCWLIISEWLFLSLTGNTFSLAVVVFFPLRSAIGSTHILLPPAWLQDHFTLVIPVLILFTFDNFCAFNVIYYGIICYNIIIFCLLVLVKMDFIEVLLLLAIIIHLLLLYNTHDINQCIKLSYPYGRLVGTLESTYTCERWHLH